MNDIAIRVENLSKLYHIGAKQERYKTLRNALTDAMYAPFRAVRSALNGRRSAVGGQQSSVNGQRSAVDSHIWALKDVSFEVKRGEVVGIIGRNAERKGMRCDR